MKKGQEAEEINDVVPELNTEIRIYPFDTQHVLIESNNHQLKINKQFELLINMIDGKKTISKICETYEIETHQIVSPMFVYNALYTDLATYGIVKSELPIKLKERALHLRLSFIFWKGNSLSFLSRLLSNLFTPRLFYTLLIGMSLFSFTVLLLFRSIENKLQFTNSNIILYASCTFAIVMLHEIGHVAACNKFGAKHKGIGFGFYLLSPVFFADVSDAWKLPQKQRLIVNLGGVYIEFIIVTLIFTAFLITANPILFYIGITILIHIGINLNPFLRYDGYWILSDITNITNLRSKSAETLKNSFNIDRIREYSFTDFLLAMYALVSYISIALFLFFVFYYDSQAVLNFPVKVFKTLFFLQFKQRSIGEISESFFRNIVPLLFYLFSFRVLFRLIKNSLKKRNVREK
jgi:putative peptide zinc metalloprotease protein